MYQQRIDMIDKFNTEKGFMEQTKSDTARQHI